MDIFLFLQNWIALRLISGWFRILGSAFEQQFNHFPFIPLSASHLDVTNCAQVTSQSRRRPEPHAMSGPVVNWHRRTDIQIEQTGRADSRHLITHLFVRMENKTSRARPPAHTHDIVHRQAF